MSIKEDIEKYKNQFYKIYYDEILPTFKTLEDKRKKQHIKFWTVLIVCTSITILTTYYYFCDTEGILNQLSGLLGIITGFTAIIVPLAITQFFVSDIKSICMKKALSALGRISWKEDSYISEKELINSELFDSNLAISSDDSFMGTYNNVPFKVAELLLGGDGAKNIFKGVVISLKSNKTIKNKTIIATKHDRSLRKHSNPYLLQIIFSFPLLILSFVCFYTAFVYSGKNIGDTIFQKGFFIGIGIILGSLLFALILDCIEKHKKNISIIKNENLKQVKLEDPIFNKKYNVYSSDQIEGRYLVTTAFMERFKNLQTAFGTNKIKCSFVDDNIMFAISTNRNVFEIGSIFKSLTKPEIMERFFNELISIYLMIDYFKLNEQTKL